MGLAPVTHDGLHHVDPGHGWRTEMLEYESVAVSVCVISLEEGRTVVWPAQC